MSAPHGSIATKAVNCLSVWDQVEQGLHDELITKLQFQEQKHRFQVWSASSGVQEIGTDSMKYQLRDASSVSSQIRRLLREIEALLLRAEDISSGKVIPWDRQTSLDSDISDDDLGDLEMEMPGTELEHIAVTVKAMVDSLLTLNLTVGDPAPRDRFSFKVPPSILSVYSSYYRRQVEKKFPEVGPELSKQLGDALARRRAYFDYRKTQRELQTSKVAKERTSDASRRGYQREAYKIAIVPSDNGHDYTHIPALPKKAKDGPFRCSFCYMTIVAKNYTDWTKHVYADLQPYSCTTAQCPAASREFTKHSEWIAHMERSHWTIYRCPIETCVFIPVDLSSIENHFRTDHAAELAVRSLDAWMHLAAATGTPVRAYRCPFCTKVEMSVEPYQQHLSQHLLELAVLALPAVDSTHMMRFLHHDDTSDQATTDYSSHQFSDTSVSEATFRYASTSKKGSSAAQYGFDMENARGILGYNTDQPWDFQWAMSTKRRKARNFDGRDGSSSPSNVSDSDPMERLDELETEFRQEWLPQCHKYIKAPPSIENKREETYHKLSEAIMLKIVMKLDGIETHGNADVRARRKALIKEVQDIMEKLDTAKGS